MTETAVVEKINEIFDSILYTPYSKSITELVLLYDKTVIDSKYLHLFITTTLSHITANHIYDSTLGSLYRKCAEVKINHFLMTHIQPLIF